MRWWLPSKSLWISPSLLLFAVCWVTGCSGPTIRPLDGIGAGAVALPGGKARAVGEIIWRGQTIRAIQGEIGVSFRPYVTEERAAVILGELQLVEVSKLRTLGTRLVKVRELAKWQEALDRLESHPEVESVEPNIYVELKGCRDVVIPPDDEIKENGVIDNKFTFSRIRFDGFRQ